MNLMSGFSIHVFLNKKKSMTIIMYTAATIQNAPGYPICGPMAYAAAKDRYIRIITMNRNIAENISKPVKLYDDYKTAMAEVKRLNAAEREKLEGAGGNG